MASKILFPTKVHYSVLRWALRVLALSPNNIGDHWSMWIDNDFPKLLGAELYRPHPSYIVEMAVEPVD